MGGTQMLDADVTVDELCCTYFTSFAVSAPRMISNNNLLDLPL